MEFSTDTRTRSLQFTGYAVSLAKQARYSGHDLSEVVRDVGTLLHSAYAEGPGRATAMISLLDVGVPPVCLFVVCVSYTDEEMAELVNRVGEVAEQVYLATARLASAFDVFESSYVTPLVFAQLVELISEFASVGWQISNLCTALLSGGLPKDGVAVSRALELILSRVRGFDGGLGWEKVSERWALRTALLSGYVTSGRAFALGAVNEEAATDHCLFALGVVFDLCESLERYNIGVVYYDQFIRECAVHFSIWGCENFVKIVLAYFQTYLSMTDNEISLAEFAALYNNLPAGEQELVFLLCMDDEIEEDVFSLAAALVAP